MATPCKLCGGFHDTPRQSKNCQRRVRKYSQSSPKAPNANVYPSVQKFCESKLLVAYRNWLSSLEADDV